MTKVILFAALLATSALCSIGSGRPPYQSRLFHSPVIDGVTRSTALRIKDPVLANLFASSFPNPLDTTVHFNLSNNLTAVLTGDIPASWIRDAANQMGPYLRFAGLERALAVMLAGVVREMTRQVLSDPYANAFLFGNVTSPWTSDRRTPKMGVGVWEGKFEIDTLASFLSFSMDFLDATGDTAPLVESPRWLSAVNLTLSTLDLQRKGMDPFDRHPVYSFERQTGTPTDTLLRGVGALGRYTGMIRTPFRPSDDATTLPFHVPANFMLAGVLPRVAEAVDRLFGAAGQRVSELARDMTSTIESGIEQFAVVRGPHGEDIFAYEVDGYGQSVLMDDAGVPSLVSLPLFFNLSSLGVAAQKVYANTRAFSLSPRNPYFFDGMVGWAGVGSPHTPYGNIWPMGLISQGLTASTDAEVASTLQMLVNSTAGTPFIHESFNARNATDFSRPWFAWANVYFGHFVLEVARTRPHLIF